MIIAAIVHSKLNADESLKSPLKRCDHSALTLNITGSLSDVFLFGGCIEWEGVYKHGNYEIIPRNDTVILQLGKS